MNFRVEIKNKEASAVAGYIVCGNSDYSITFAFDSEWAALPVKTARFIYTQDDQVKHKDVVFEGVTVDVPILRDITEVFVGVFAGELHTTTPLRIACKKSILCGDDSIQDEPAPDVYAQILGLVNNKIVGERELPPVSADDKDKVLAVDKNGVWGAVEKAAKAKEAEHADSANFAHEASEADKANFASSAGEAEHAKSANLAINADEAEHAVSADKADHAATASEAESVNKVTPVHPSAKWGRGYLDFKADTRDPIYVNVQLGDFIEERYHDDGKTYVYYRYTGETKFSLLGYWSGWTFTYKNKSYTVTTGEGGWVIYFEPGGELAEEAVGGKGVSIYAGTLGQEDAALKVGDAKHADRADLATKLDFSKKVTTSLSPQVTLTEAGLYYFENYGFVYWDGSGSACTPVTAFPDDDQELRVYVVEIQANGIIKGYYSSVDENQWLEMENPSSVIMNYYKIF